VDASITFTVGITLDGGGTGFNVVRSRLVYAAGLYRIH